MEAMMDSVHISYNNTGNISRVQQDGKMVNVYFSPGNISRFQQNGKMVNVYFAPGCCNQENADKAFDKLRALFGIFYYPLLITVDEEFDHYRDYLENEHKFRFQKKKDWMQHRAPLKELIERCYSQWYSEQYYDEYSETVQEDLRPLIEKLRHAVFNCIGKYVKDDVQEVVYRIMIADLTWRASQHFNDCCSQIYKKYGVDFKEYFHYISPTKLATYNDSWFTDNERKLSKAIHNDNDCRLGITAVEYQFLDEKRIADREIEAYNNIDDDIRHLWIPMTQRPKNNRVIKLFWNDKVREYSYRNGHLYNGKELVMDWPKDAHCAWLYKTEYDKGPDDISVFKK